MNHTTGTITAANGLKLHTESWVPEGDVRAVVLLVHGYDEHIGRYPHVAEMLVSHHYAVYGYDQRGHGQSEGLRVYVEHYSQLVDDLKLYFDTVRAQQPGKKIFLYGHSLGSMVALSFVLAHQGDLAGLITSGCILNTDEPVSPLLLALSSTLAKIIPKVHFVALDADAISRDPAVVAAYKADPMVTRKPIRVGLAADLVAEGRRIRANLAQITLPLLILHGTEDRLAPPSGSQTLYDGAGSSDKTLKLYEGLYHEVHNEPEKETVFADITSWLDSH